MSILPKYCRNQKGLALVLTLLAVVLITTMVVEFSYGVYTGTNTLYNWRDAQRLSLMARSGVSVSANFLMNLLETQEFSYPGFIEMPVENPFEDFRGVILVRIEDENAKFNLNTIVFANGLLNETAYFTFQRLLKALSLNEKIADRVADWIDPDREQRLRDSETGARNAPLLSTDELSLIPGIEKDEYTSLLPYVTVFGDGLVNLNGAEKPVLRSLHPEITDDLAARVIEYRRIKPFEQREDILKVAGFETTIGQALMGRIAVQGTSFAIRANAESDGIKRIIESVIDSSGSVRYWKEY